ncbi:Protein involved in initiation of plasmid replication [Pseudobutyrivibrio sp. C4]|uniref:replication initiation protein n=1 Tax=Pseudobutyrivibrio sp. C4 TaxID=1520803 RepID=UPI0008BC5CB7|nr:replication initiation protein [Pseudobutyrivibrio sp. C4]SES91896.1 Protein involved in initiation of plasmid replication [Pseudobutyrivibrio sp. C4]
MAYVRQDENGIYRDVNPKTNRFYDEDEYPIGSKLGQVDHQYTHTNKGRLIDRDDVSPDVIDSETGLAVTSEDENKIKTFIKEAISIDNLVETFDENSHETLLKLLALQDNKHPLKKGGVGIAYRTDALIMHCKMEFSAEENVVFDAILGTISTFPENKTYRIEPSSFIKFSKYKVENTLYDVFRKGTAKLTERHLVFDELGPDGQDDIVVPWFDILRYHKKGKNNDVAYIEFKPSDFFKDLALCSGIIHGAFGSMEVTTQLQGKYTIALYWYLENMKNYKEYPTATPGVFEISIEELKHQFSMPQSYTKTDIERRALIPAKASINSIELCDFTFDYEAKKESGKYVGFIFRITNKSYIESTAVEMLDDNQARGEDSSVIELRMLLAISKLEFSEEEIQRIAACAKKFNKDSAYMMQVVSVFKQRIENKSLDPVDDKIGYICRMIEKGATAKISSNDKKKKNNFNNFSQRDYDMDELEKKLIGH